MANTNDKRKVSLTFSNRVTNLDKLKEYQKTLVELKREIKTMPKKVVISSSGIKDYSSQLDKVINSLNAMQKTTDDVQKKTKNAFDIGRLIIFARYLKRVGTTLARYTAKSTAYIENINLYQVAFNGAYEGADKFVNKISEMYGLDESNLVRAVGVFKQLTNAMNIAAETGEKVSTLLTQMAIDISSLYNVDIDRAISVLQSAMAGQTRPIRRTTGADVTVATLQKTLSDIGINRYINQLSYAEKRLLIIISLTQQLAAATNDFGRTIESPANQIRILKEQWERLTRAVGSVFLPILAKILPYLNAALMILTEILNTVAALFGFKIAKFDYFKKLDERVLDVEDSMNKASKAANKLKNGVRGFDKLNIITTPKAASGIGGGIGGIDPKILSKFNDVFKDYNSKLTDIQMKATKIRDRIMEWLGYTKLVDEATGDVSFKFDHIKFGTIVGAAGAFASLLGILKIIGSFIGKIFGVKTIGKITLFGSASAKAAGKVGGLTAKSLGLKGALTGLASKLGVSLSTLSLIIAAIVAALAAIGFYIYKSFQPANKQLNIFKGLSKETESKLRPLITRVNSLDEAIKKIDITKTITKKDVEKVKTNLKGITDYIKKDYQNDLNTLEKLISSKKLYPDLTPKQREEMIQNLKTANAKRVKEIDNAEKEIKDIINKAYKEKRELKAEEVTRIEELERELKEKSVETVTENKEEQKKLYESMKENAINLSIEQYSNILQEAKKHKDKIIKNAKEERDKKIEGARILFEDLHAIDEEEYKKMVDDAKTNYKAIKEEAIDSYNKIASAVEEKLGDAAENINTETGKIKNKFTRYLEEILAKWNKLTFPQKVMKMNITSIGGAPSKLAKLLHGMFKVVFTSEHTSPKKSKGIEARASGGFPPVGQMFVAREKGPELVGNIGSQTAVVNNDQIVASVSAGVSKAVAGAIGNKPQILNIYLDKDEKLATYVLDKFGNMAKANGEPFIIGG